MKVNLLLEHIQSQPSSEISLRCNNKNYKIIAASIIPLMSIATAVQIPVKYQQFAQILAREQKVLSQQQQSIQGEFSIVKATQLINFAKKYFNRVIKIDLTVLAMKYFLSDDTKKQEQIQSIDLDKLPLQSIIKLYKLGIDLLSVKMRHRVTRFLKKYINDTKRSSNQKDILHQLHKSLKNLKDIESDGEDWADVEENQQQNKNSPNKLKTQLQQEVLAFKKQKKQQKHRNKTPLINQVFQTQKSQKSSDGESSLGKNKMSKKILKGAQNQQKIEQVDSDDEKNRSSIKQESKPKARRGGPRSKQNHRGYSNNRNSFGDERILLGIRGDTLSGWRQRYRPKKCPQSQLVEVKRQRTSIVNGSRQNIQNAGVAKRDDQGVIVVKKQYKKVQQPKKQQGSLSVVYKFPTDKTKVFKFNASKSYRIKVNDAFWINVQPDKQNTTILLINSNKGFVRKGKIKLIDDGKGFMTDGLTFSFDSICNMQDGGIAFGEATVLDFIPSGKQWFALESVEVLSYE